MSGEIAAVLTAVCFAYNAIQFNIAGQRITSVIVNRMRILWALPLLILLHWLLLGTLLPLDADWERFGWLSLSSLIGFVLGDAALFEALVLLGARLTVLLTTLIPFFGSLIAWVSLGERITLGEWPFILLTMGGVAWVITERPQGGATRPRRLLLGLALGLFATFAQALGLVFSKLGLSGDYPALSGTLIRTAVAVILLWLPAVARRRIWHDFKALRDGVARQALLKGTVIGPVIGVTLSLYAVQYARVGIATTLMGLIPIFLLPLARIILKERVSWRAWLGTGLAITGAVALML